MVGIMDRLPGQKEKRWYHKLAPKPIVEELNDGISVYVPGPDKRIDQVEEMTQEFTDLKDEVETLRYQLGKYQMNSKISANNSNKTFLKYRALFYRRAVPVL